MEAFNRWRDTRKTAKSLKVAKVLPKFKKSERDSPENYRPNSLLCSINKIFEKLQFYNGGFLQYQ